MDAYLQTTTELFDLQKFAIKLGLENITNLSSFFNNPHLKYPTIHIAGTNGKGSTAFYISRILQRCGLKVGLFTSPHLVDFRERIRINDTLITREYVIEFWEIIKAKVLQLQATFFDTTTLMAYKYFADQKVDIAIFETGLGGRLDSTNIIQSEYAVITPISFDHQKQLGNKLQSIANEKAGIVKKASQIFLARQHPKVTEMFRSRFKENNLFYIPDILETKIIEENLNGISFSVMEYKNPEKFLFTIPTFATYQTENIAQAFYVAKNYCINSHLQFPYEQVSHAINSSSWPGRLQIIQKNPNIIFDVSHNISGIKKTVKALMKFIDCKKTDLLIGIVNDKDAYNITKFLSGKFRYVIVTEPETARKQDGSILMRMFEKQKQNVKFIKDLSMAFELCKNTLKNDETLIALGSHYLVGALMRSG